MFSESMKKQMLDILVDMKMDTERMVGKINVEIDSVVEVANHNDQNGRVSINQENPVVQDIRKLDACVAEVLNVVQRNDNNVPENFHADILGELNQRLLEIRAVDIKDSQASDKLGSICVKLKHLLETLELSRNQS